MNHILHVTDNSPIHEKFQFLTWFHVFSYPLKGYIQVKHFAGVLVWYRERFKGDCILVGANWEEVCLRNLDQYFVIYWNH